MADSTHTTITTQVPTETEGLVLKAIGNANANLQRQHGEAIYCTHGVLDPSKLMTLLLEDVGYTQSRPGSWEGSTMSDLLERHGYDVTERF